MLRKKKDPTGRPNIEVDAKAFYLEHRQTMWRAAQRVLLNESVEGVSVEDIVQKVLLKVVEKGLPKDIDNVEAYVVAMTTNCAIDVLRKKIIHSQQPSETGQAIRDPEAVVQRNILLDRTGKLIKELKPEEQYAVIQRVLLARPRKDVATEMGCSPSRVSQLVGDALRKIKAGLEEGS